jgi:hypothetical protein
MNNTTIALAVLAAIATIAMVMTLHTADAARPSCTGTCKHFEEGPPDENANDRATRHAEIVVCENQGKEVGICL